jgi:hypothetical protein
MGQGESLLFRVWTLISCLPRGPVVPRIPRTAFKRWAGGRQRGRPFKDGGQLISAGGESPAFASRKTNQPLPVLLHMRSGPRRCG